MLEIHIVKCRQNYALTGRSAEFFFLVVDMDLFNEYKSENPDLNIVGEIELGDLKPDTRDQVLSKLPGAVKHGFAVV